MMSTVLAAALHGIEGYPVHVEVDFRAGLPAFTIVGLPDTAVRESRERVISAIRNTGFSFPPQRITINLAPAHIKKEGASFDLALAIGILLASGIIQESVNEMAFLGELGLDGSIKPIQGVLPAVLGLKKMGVGSILLPSGNAKEAALVDGIRVFPFTHLTEVVRFLNKELECQPFLVEREKIFESHRSHSVDFAEVKGQLMAKRALEIAAAGGHNILLIGPPGSGKTLLARRLPTILPDLHFDEALETTKIHSVAGTLRHNTSLLATRPYRSPHHQISNVALIGGGANPRPGEVSLAHRGVLFLDEFPEFNRNVLEGLRQPLEDRFVTISRVNSTVRYPADFLLIAAANPCPCGYLGATTRLCDCTPPSVQKYRAKFSGPLLDRIDLHVEVPFLDTDQLMGESADAESSESIRHRVVCARQRQRKRLEAFGLYENGQMEVKHIRLFCTLESRARSLLKQAIRQLGLSARAYDRILKISRTIADLAVSDEILPHHMAEAIGYRMLDRGEPKST